VGRARQRNEEEIRRWRRVRWPAIKKAPKEGRTIIFIDESRISQRPPPQHIPERLRVAPLGHLEVSCTICWQ
jgi:hypothetical protein